MTISSEKELTSWLREQEIQKGKQWYKKLSAKKMFTGLGIRLLTESLITHLTSGIFSRQHEHEHS